MTAPYALGTETATGRSNAPTAAINVGRILRFMCAPRPGGRGGGGAMDACATDDVTRGGSAARTGALGMTSHLVGGDRGMTRFLPVCSRLTISKLSF
ncbi:hypothetical protein Pth03_64080 [Planotetraspora thailandica]|uniref:Uncharacterized protein n=1 Tax=Planotetraspora thailandica TaxID=487172 RepID=A0A8J4DCK0_9ACTN|nr:hypothetical protein Pth03_64080 [Planotetraspora thailandica]